MILNYEDNEYRLCYIDNHIMYFTDNFAKQWGDDWDDAPYEHNAGLPYEYRKDWPDSVNEHAGHFRYLAYVATEYSWEICTPKQIPYGNNFYSVADINSGIAPWLTNLANKDGLMAGATIEQAIEWCHKNGLKTGELK